MNEREVRDRLAAAFGEPPAAAGAVHRLEAHLDAVPAGRRGERAHPRGMALIAAALGLLLVAGLLASQAARWRRAAPAPAATAAAPSPGCLPGAPDQLIVIDLTAQRLTAYDRGCPFLTTPVTTGRPSLPTRPGTYHVLAKRPRFQLTSPWPPGDPRWYPETTVHDYVVFSTEGDALHSAEWEPPSAYGPGSEAGPYAGTTVHVPLPAVDRLYRWARVGATVEVRSGG